MAVVLSLNHALPRPERRDLSLDVSVELRLGLGEAPLRNGRGFKGGIEGGFGAAWSGDVGAAGAAGDSSSSSSFCCCIFCFRLPVYFLK